MLPSQPFGAPDPNTPARSNGADQTNTQVGNGIDFRGFRPFSAEHLRTMAPANPLRLAVTDVAFYPPQGAGAQQACPVQGVNIAGQHIRTVCEIIQQQHVHSSQYEVVIDRADDPLDAGALSRVQNFVPAARAAAAGERAIEVTTRHIFPAQQAPHPIPPRIIAGQQITEDCEVQGSFHTHRYRVGVNFPILANPIPRQATQFSQSVVHAPLLPASAPLRVPSAPAVPPASALVAPALPLVTLMPQRVRGVVPVSPAPQLRAILPRPPLAPSVVISTDFPQNKTQAQDKMRRMGVTGSRTYVLPSGWFSLPAPLREQVMRYIRTCHQMGVCIAELVSLLGLNCRAVRGLVCLLPEVTTPADVERKKAYDPATLPAYPLQAPLRELLENVLISSRRTVALGRVTSSAHQRLNREIARQGVQHGDLPEHSFPMNWEGLDEVLQALYAEDVRQCYEQGHILKHIERRHGITSCAVYGLLFDSGVSLWPFVARRDPNTGLRVKHRLKYAAQPTAPMPPLPLGLRVRDVVAYRELLNPILQTARTNHELTGPLSSLPAVMQRLRQVIVNNPAAAPRQARIRPRLDDGSSSKRPRLSATVTAPSTSASSASASAVNSSSSDSSSDDDS